MVIENPAPADHRPLVVHVVFNFDTGGLENGIVNLINHMPASRYRHVIVALTHVANFRKRIERRDVIYFSLNKPPGHGVWMYLRLFRLFRMLRPDVVHTRNLAALEVVVPAWLARVPVRIHGEHGRDVGDLDGTSRKYQVLRKMYRPFVSHYMALSRDLTDYLVSKVGVPVIGVTQAYNGVDSAKFRIAEGERPSIVGCPFTDSRLWLIGTVGRMQTVKNQTTLAQAFIDLILQHPELRARVRLVMVGEGPLRERAIALLESARLADLAWLPGERNDVADVMRGLDCFVLPSLAEGISNTILEAMACGIPVLATDVGGNAELVVNGTTGQLVPPADSGAIARQLALWAAAPEQAKALGRAGRELVEEKFNMSAMVQTYQGLYDQQLGIARRRLATM